MKVVMQASEPDSIQVTLQVTMTLKHWKEIRDQLNQKHPAVELVRAINDCVYQTQKAFWASSLEDEAS